MSKNTSWNRCCSFRTIALKPKFFPEFLWMDHLFITLDVEISIKCCHRVSFADRINYACRELFHYARE